MRRTTKEERGKVRDAMRDELRKLAAEGSHRSPFAQQMLRLLKRRDEGEPEAVRFQPPSTEAERESA